MSKQGKKLLIGDRVKQARTRAGLTQETLARATGIGQSHISEIEAGNRGLKAEQLYQIAKATKKPLEFFVK